ncbi:hypothetical protein MNL06_02995 [Bartonella krasnovii]|uniref:hypothetical protein n=1 Tax=Bartonella krasnovii TaxID=2267275 RepID=UPI001F4CD46F|nr:hypothetical protein [Bartonella krasnovii]UNF46073.1 hypothetical protein MNL06_02995 [Bartonella krasnovii]
MALSNCFFQNASIFFIVSPTIFPIPKTVPVDVTGGGDETDYNIDYGEYNSIFKQVD